MQPRTKRLLKIWLGIIAKLAAFAVLGLLVGWVLSIIPANIAAALIIGAIVIFVGYTAWQVAKTNLEIAEIKEARVLRDLSKGYNE
jgi:xanthosine utilization system XapX-like protein